MLVSEVKTKDWQLSTEGVGEIAQGIDDIRQCIYNIIFTPKGAIPFDLSFGTNIYLYMDYPVNVIIAKLTKEIKDGISLYETRVNLKSLNWSLADFVLTVKLTIEIPLTKEQYDLFYDVSGFKQAVDELIYPPYAIEDGRGKIIGDGTGKYITYVHYNKDLKIDNTKITIDSNLLTIDKTYY